MKSVIIFLIAFILLFSATGDIRAYTIPTFPACTKPEGTLKAKYTSGTHGIVGDFATYTGSDEVYQVTQDTLLQCFCAPDNQGIQTFWWRIADLDDSEINQLKNLGWHYVPNGALWGLDENPYMAKNADYSCGSEENPSGGGGEILPTAASTTGSVLGLAETGSFSSIISFAFLGLGSVLTGLFLLYWRK